MQKLNAAVIVLGVLAVAPVFGQVVEHPLGGLVDGYREAIRLRMEQDRIRTEAELARSKAQLMNAQTEAIRLQTERLKLQNQATAPAPPTAVDDAIRAVIARYPDFLEYREEAARLMAELDTSKGPANMNLEHYFEALYLVAKHASFSRLFIPPYPATPPKPPQK